MAELCMALAETTAAPTETAETPAAPQPTADPALTLARLTHAVRQAIALERRIIADLQHAADEHAAIPPDSRRTCLRRAIHQLADTLPDHPRFRAEAIERIDTEIAADPDGVFNIPDIFSAIIRDFGINLEETGLPEALHTKMPALAMRLATTQAIAAQTARLHHQPKAKPFQDLEPPGAWWADQLPEPVRDG